MKNLLPFVFAVCFTVSLFGQTVSGVVLDAQTNKPIKGAHVYFSSIDKGTVTHFHGKFRLKYSDDRVIDSVYVSHIGYNKMAFPIVENKKRYIIYLESKSNTLGEVQIANTNKRLKHTIRYNKLTSMKRGLYSFGSLMKDDKIYVVGGNITYKEDPFKRMIAANPDFGIGDIIQAARPYFSKAFYRGDLLVYDLNLDHWVTNDIPFRKRAYHNVHFHDDKLYVLGGKRLSRGRKYEYLDDKIEVFDSENNSIVVDDTNPHQAVDFASFTYDDKIIVMGGSIAEKKSGRKVYSNKVHLYDLKTGLWFEMASMPTAKETSGVRINNTIYLIGGINDRAVPSIETFDLISGKWTKEGDLFESFKKPAVTHNENMIYAFEDSKLIKYNTVTHELSQYLIDLDLKESKLFCANNKLYILGGYRENSYSLTPSPHLYSIDLREFETTKARKSKTL